MSVTRVDVNRIKTVKNIGLHIPVTNVSFHENCSLRNSIVT